MKREYNDVNGILLVDKAADWTSHDAVNCVRRRFAIKKTGHCGTLDPFATGLLILLLGKSTKQQDILMGHDKRYSATMRLGIETDSQDCTGEVVAEKPVPEFSEAQLLKVAESFIGEQQQLPPMHSAIKINGQPLYKLAHKGKVVEREPRNIVVHEFKITRIALPEVDFEVLCSKGTYVRTLAADFGARLGCGAHLVALRRLAIGEFSVADAAGIEDIKNWELPQLLEHLR